MASFGSALGNNARPDADLIMLSAPVLFVDFDGVLHPYPSESDQLFCHMPLLQELLREFPQVEVVVSSSWGQSFPFDHVLEFFPDELKPRVIDVTPGSLLLSEIPPRLWNYVREAQCSEWIRSHRPGTPWLAIDDQGWRFDPASANVLLVDGKTGITDADVSELRRRFRAWAIA